ncbi:hypothetical protein P1A145kb_p178 [Pectobacterium phage DU_PP_I]|nr:hypothetical protein P1A145kb_p178 [Pectobacterium phage DU_PP_I]ATS93895.1 hypothetical protein P12B145kb_p179 [Pectobacterium phage DU_PP_IV]
MSEIKDVIEKLARDWSWNAVAKHDLRKQILTRNIEMGGGLRIQVPTGPNFSREFTFRHEKKNGDLRIWTKSMNSFLQWRTDPKKGDRLVYRAFGKDIQTERVPLEEIFMDPQYVDEGEVAMFEMLYADLVPLLPMFAEALVKADEYLEKNFWMF